MDASTEELKKRQNSSRILMEKYTGRIPVIVTKKDGSSLPDLVQKKFLVPDDMTIGKFIIMLRSRNTISAQQSIFMFIKQGNKHIVVPYSETFKAVYDNMKNEDGYLYLIYSDDSVFG